mmetsp:Transcript_94103/g.251952  ORF Transcript_94103/g.251952 Transcript_94103/m.251952 type:complete len:81 (-) Transcript_94103:83-325(-)
MPFGLLFRWPTTGERLNVSRTVRPALMHQLPWFWNKEVSMPAPRIDAIKNPNTKGSRFEQARNFHFILNSVVFCFLFLFF